MTARRDDRKACERVRRVLLGNAERLADAASALLVSVAEDRVLGNAWHPAEPERRAWREQAQLAAVLSDAACRALDAQIDRNKANEAADGMTKIMEALAGASGVKVRAPSDHLAEVKMLRPVAEDDA